MVGWGGRGCVLLAWERGCVLPLQAFIGNRYGYRPVPAQITESDFTVLTAVAALKESCDVSLLKEWYQLDGNAVPPVYQLQPITSKFPHFISPDKKLRGADQNSWWETFQKLQRLIWTLAKMAVAEKKMSPERGHHFLMSGMRATLCSLANGSIYLLF